MKNRRLTLAMLAIFGIATIFTGCKKDEEVKGNKLPARFKVDIPSSLSKNNGQKKSVNIDTLKGNEIYQNLNTFIYVGESAADLVQAIMYSISVNNIDHAMDITYTSNEDYRVKHLVVVENSGFENLTYQFQLTITDKLSENAADGGKALQVFWNTNPIKGIAIVKPYNCNRGQNAGYPDALYRIDYSEAGELGYNSHMIVAIAGLPVASPLTDPYSMSSLKMFAGKNGDNIDVYGNSEHPNAKFFTNETGFNWAFVASSSESDNIGVAEVGLPSDSINSTDRNVLLKDNSIHNVFESQILYTWPNINSTDLANYLQNTSAPGYFNSTGFIQGGTSPGAQWDALYTRTEALTPYSPLEMKNLVISFK
ncbi:MAG: hypothetical protein WCK02_02660 [Bacteroidota bacterium]